MAIGRTNAGGAGGAALNFKVVPGLTQPETASENTIWVKTEKIGAWYFSATQPEGMQEWDVWFPVGTSSTVEFNALKKNGIMVYPLSAKQYISGAFVDVTAKSYQGGEWVNWTTYLYNKGDQCTDLTGGWNVYKESNSGYDVNFNNADISITHNGGNDSWSASVFTKETIDVTNYTKLILDMRYKHHYTNSAFTAGLTSAPKNYPSFIAKTEIRRTDETQVQVTVDLSGVEGNYYVGFRSAYVLASVYTIRLE